MTNYSLPCTRFHLPLFLLLLLPSCLSDPRTTVASLYCSNATTPPPSLQSFVSSFVSAIESLTHQVHSHGYALVSDGGGGGGGGGEVPVYMFAECIGDLNPVDCDLCVAWAKTQILKCSPYQFGTRGGTLFGDGCFLRYETYDFFVDRRPDPRKEMDASICGTEDYAGGDVTLFSEMVAELGRNLTVEGVRNGGFYAGEAARGNVSVYGLVQCWEYAKRAGECGKCLADGMRRASSCVPKTEGKGLGDGCYVRYSTQKFYSNDTAPRPFGGDEGQLRLSIILATTLSGFAFLMIIAAATISLRMRIARRRRERWQMGLLADSVNKSKLNFSYECLEKATNYFHPSNKLGQGGSGSVYKGTLPDGRTVAIKRLVFNTRQWVEHFFNEVNLISDIDHVNLVKMLGCSITGPESLLVYEYIPNHSLMEHILAEKKRQKLSWDMRFNIILGTAKGLAYLHEESYLRIIHRDIKLSNVLLDEDFKPKIADFGLARLFPEDKTHISTAIAGTLGYMAPEYVVRGQLTEKADVYSYGVLVIEVVSGTRNNRYINNSCSILQMVWLMYRSGRLAEVVDGSLDFFPEEVACLALRVGLLCVQAAPELRPTMSMVVRMLKEECEIPEPSQPPFLSSSISLSSQQDVSARRYDSRVEESDGLSSSSCDGTESFTNAR
ncbi:hypothetical protein MLD38_028227 [Melastoma candidum]|uniref:Uncharacterized protein n=1 Tax=Melastoma candidum TaxID=119954 RepID=A0ACB9N0E9_9MYRT|nr:hypothetical protein MLD38_028227 [Melastoma candidum]